MRYDMRPRFRKLFAAGDDHRPSADDLAPKRLSDLSRHRHPDLAVLVECGRINFEAGGLAVQTGTGAQVVAPLVERADDGRAAGQPVGERAVEMGTLGLG